MTECPRCKEDMPLLSKICPVCGYVIVDSEKDITAVEFMNSLEENLHDIKSIPEPTFFRSLSQFTFIVLPILAVYLLIMASISEAGLFWLLFIIVALLSITAIVKKCRGTLGNDVFNKEFRTIKNNYEYNSRLAKRNYGKSKEVINMLNEISAQISELESSRKSKGVRNLIIWIVILLIFFALATTGVFSVNKALNSPDKTEISDEDIIL